MLFNSIEYFVFFLIVLTLYWVLPHGGRRLVLLVASVVFYLSWSFAFLLHFTVVLAVNYPLLLWIFRRRAQGREAGGILLFAVILNFLNLGFFKYFYFLAGTLGQLSSNATLLAIARHEASWLPEIILPLAISFYTFQLVALHVDAYRGMIPQAPSFLGFSLFFTYFPHLLAGPIVRHDQLMPQLYERKDPERVDVVRACALILAGFVKKVMIADFLVETTVPVLSRPLEYQGVHVLLAIYFFFIQVYCDFSGYTDMARGSGLLFGFELPVNFRGPMFSLSFQEFWQRWHITLTQWLRDYLYIALGGNRGGEVRTYFNLFATFLLGGVWHGAGWGYAIWGGFHGAYLAWERFWYKAGEARVQAGTKTSGSAAPGGKTIRKPSWGRRTAESNRDFALRSAYNVFKNIVMILLMSLIGVFFFAGLDVGLGMDAIYSIFGGGGNKLSRITARHGAVMLLYFGLHWIEYNDYFARRGADGVFSPGAWTAPAYRFAWAWVPVAAVLALFYSSWKAGGDLPFVYFQF